MITRATLVKLAFGVQCTVPTLNCKPSCPITLVESAIKVHNQWFTLKFPYHSRPRHRLYWHRVLLPFFSKVFWQCQCFNDLVSNCRNMFHSYGINHNLCCYGH